MRITKRKKRAFKRLCSDSFLYIAVGLAILASLEIFYIDGSNWNKVMSPEERFVTLHAPICIYIAAAWCYGIHRMLRPTS